MRTGTGMFLEVPTSPSSAGGGTFRLAGGSRPTTPTRGGRQQGGFPPVKPRSAIRTVGLTRKGKSRLTSGRPRVSIGGGDLAGLPPPRPAGRQALDWQLQRGSVMDRVVSLFNCYNMSDVIFHMGTRQIPAHRFVMSAASPVLHKQLMEYPVTDEPGKNTRQRVWRRPSNTSSYGHRDKLADLGPFGISAVSTTMQTIDIRFDGSRRPSRLGTGSVLSGTQNHMSSQDQEATIHVEVAWQYEDFYELLRFLYTDQVALSLRNVAALLSMSDDFKLPSLAERCLKFLKEQVRPENCLRILEILRVLMKKAILCLWRENVEREKALKRFKEMTLAERQRRLAQLRDTAGTESGRSSRLDMAMSRTASKDSLVAPSEVPSFVSATPSHFRAPSRQSMDPEEAHIYRLLGEGEPKHTHSHAGKSLYYQLALASEELSERCWRNIREFTETVLLGDDWCTQELTTVRAVLRLDMVNVSEATLFRALNRWAEHQCRMQGLPELPEHRRKVLGEGTLQLVRFPTMTLQELHWEVVPTGMLTYQDLQQLQAAICRRESLWLPQYNGEPRSRPGDLGARRRVKHHKEEEGAGLEATGSRLAGEDDEASRPAVGAFGCGVHVPAEGDEHDALLGAKLWRSHVDTFLEEQEDLGMAYEATLVGEDRSAANVRSPTSSHPTSPTAADTRPVTAWVDIADYFLRRGGDSVHRRGPERLNSRQQRRPGAPSAMVLYPQAQLPALTWSAGAAWTGEALPARASTAPPGARGPAEAALLRQTTPLALGARGLEMPTPSGQVAQDWAGPAAGDLKWPVAPADLQRVSKGRYRFRGKQLVELRMVNGEPLVYEVGTPTSPVSSVGRRPVPLEAFIYHS